MAHAHPSEVEVAVVGGGPAGLTAAIALAAAGRRDRCVVAPRARPDNRTTALLMGSVTALADAAACGSAARTQAAPLRTMRIVDATRAAPARARGRRSRPPRSAARRSATTSRTGTLRRRWRRAPPSSRRSCRSMTQPQAIEVSETGGDDPPCRRRPCARPARHRRRWAQFAVPRRGRHRVASRRYPQTALTFNLGHARPHRDASTEFHTETGPFTLRPPSRAADRACLGARSGASRARAGARRRGRSATRSSGARTRSWARSTVEPGRGVFPLEIATAQAFARDASR